MILIYVYCDSQTQFVLKWLNDRRVINIVLFPRVEIRRYLLQRKVFLFVPEKDDIRKQWCEAAGTPDKKLRKVSFCCEDHFDLMNDLKNPEVIGTGGRKFLKEGVVPRFFSGQHLQKLERLTSPQGSRTALQELSERQAVDKENIPPEDELEFIEVPEKLTKIEGEFEFTEVPEKQILKTEGELEFIEIPVKTEYLKVDKSCNTGTITGHDIQVQVNMCVPHRSKSVSCEMQNIKVLRNAICQTNSSELLPKSNQTFPPSSTSDSADNDSQSSELFSYASGSTLNSELKAALLKDKMWENTKTIIELNSLLYIGTQPNSMYIIKELENRYKISIKIIYLVLEKIRLDRTNAELAFEYGISESQIAKIFKTNVHKLASILKNFILWPPADTIFRNLPLQFRNRFKRVQSIIDCFEIQIEQPSNPIHQSATWSDYKNCNTIKYLISCTPDGLVTFISEGFGGRTSDMRVVEKSGYLDVVPPNCEILADRGFKNLEFHLGRIGCKLARPSSVQSGKQLDKVTVINDKQIASLRIHVERTIRRFREFRMIRPHSCIDHNMLQHLNNIVIICAALINIQTPIINTC